MNYHEFVSQAALTEDQRKSLEFLQGIITRLSTNGFLLKGWAVTLITGLLTYTGTTGQARLALLACLPALIFWMLDAYVLAREHQYRQKFEAGRQGLGQPYDFQLRVLTAGEWFRSAFMPTLLVFYLPLVAVVLFVARRWL